MSDKLLIVDGLGRAAESQCSRLGKLLRKLGLSGTMVGLRETAQGKLAAPECKASRRIHIRSRQSRSAGPTGQIDTELDKRSFGCFGPLPSRRHRPEGMASPRRISSTSLDAQTDFVGNDVSLSFPDVSGCAYAMHRSYPTPKSAKRARHSRLKHRKQDEGVRSIDDTDCCPTVSDGSSCEQVLFRAAKKTTVPWSSPYRAEGNSLLSRFTACRFLFKPTLMRHGQILKPALVKRSCSRGRSCPSDRRPGSEESGVRRQKAKQVVVDAFVYVCQYSPEDAPNDVRSSKVQCMPVILLRRPAAIARGEESQLILGATPNL
uniref:Uncharacterized protein n=1 Tax=Toxoplasma gondii COUG TaxID=1074873 RepID=A0A2G8XP11_TOXGO|nr:hypothetical protein TGCOUG_299800 [Toxoplasma gondii COUG]